MEKCVFIGYSLEQKGYKCYNLVTRDVRMRKDVVFYELPSCYINVEDGIRVYVKENVIAKNASQQSHKH